MRLDKFLANKAIGSRKEVHEIIKKGFISVNDKIIRDKAFSISPDIDEITFKGENISTTMKYYMKINKPAGYLTAVEDRKNLVIMDLLPPEYKSMGVFPVGRLDKDTEGLLLLTNDGQWAHRVINGKKDIAKCYYFTYDGEINSNYKELIRNGLVLKDGTKFKPAELEFFNTNEGKITITEGKFHQVKRMLAALGGHITYLKRLRIGKITLTDIEEVNTYKFLNDSEINEF